MEGWSGERQVWRDSTEVGVEGWSGERQVWRGTCG